MVQADQQFRSRARDIAQLEVRSQSGRMIPIGALAEVRDTTGPQVVRRFNMFPSATISGQAAPGSSENQATTEMEVLAGQLLPTGMGYSWSGVTYQQKAAGNLAPLIFGLAFVFVFLFLAAQYESWTIPLAVMLSIPLSFLGAAGLTLIRGLDNNIYMQIGLVLLIGLSAKSAIMIVEFAKQLHEEGRSVVDAAVEAARLRFRPILMTAFSFILGVIPLLIASGAGAASRQSLGTAVFGGMLVATVTGVFFIPVLYVVVVHTVARLTGKSKAGTGSELESGAEA
jgi:HAE1 family hydrophobic/amphiphilic exporter-1